MDAFCKHGMLKTRCPICKPEVKTEKRAPKIFAEDRNLAFKCNWLDTDYEGPCGREGRRCTQPENPCYQYEMGLRKDIPPYPCYESYETEIFSKFEYGAGVNHKEGANEGKRQKNQICCSRQTCLFTTVDPGKSGDSRHIFGFFVIKDHYTDSDGATKVVEYPEYTLKIPRDSRLRFWDFYRNSDGSTFWGTGLVRYLSDEVVVNYLRKQRGFA